ncbi:DHA2 family efflux MFS transporter permease subunit [Nocardia heshunensis]
MNAVAASADTEVPIRGRRRTIALIVVLLAYFLDLLDNTIVNVALPPIQRELGAPLSSVQWVAGGYALTFAIVLITGSRLGDIFGRRRLFLIGVAGFITASALCGTADAANQLIAYRLVQGAFAALMVPQVLATIQVMYPPAQRGKAIAAFGGLAGLATVGGPILGALLTSGDIGGLGWRSIFYVNVPIGLLALVAAFFALPESHAPQAERLDILGVVLSSVALFLLVYPLIQGREAGWPLWTYGCIAASVAVLVIFFAYQRHRAATVGSPLIELRLFRLRTFNGGLLTAALFFGGVIGFFMTMTLYFQIGLGYSVLRAGLTGLPWGMAVPMFAGISAGVLVPKIGRSALQIGLVLYMLGLIGLIWTVSHFGPHVTSTQFIVPLLIGGVGMGLVVAPLVDFSLTDVPVQDAGSASGLFNTTQQLASAIGIAALGTVFFGLLGTQAAPALSHIQSQVHSGLTAADIPPDAQDQIFAQFGACFTDRVRASDPETEPVSCRTSEQQAAPPLPAVERTMRSAAGTAMADDFGRSFQRTLWVVVATGFFALLASFWLPQNKS